MKHTHLLKVLPDTSFNSGQLVIHPNDGCDLGLMQREYPVEIYVNEKVDSFKDDLGNHFPGNIILENNCKNGVVEMSQKNWDEMGQPDQIMMVYDNGKMLLLSAVVAGNNG